MVGLWSTGIMQYGIAKNVLAIRAVVGEFLFPAANVDQRGRSILTLLSCSNLCPNRAPATKKI
jgi:hypothetical protein